MTEENNANLLSNSPDEFLSRPNTTVELRKVKPPADERNVCVEVSKQENNDQQLMLLVRRLNRLCATNQVMTDRHNVALLFRLKEAGMVSRLGFCDELSASNIVYRLCDDVKATVYREYGTPKERIVTEEDLDKRPFRF